MKCNVLAISNQKGGVAKSTTAINLSVGLANRGMRVLAIDVDPQADMTDSLGCVDANRLEKTLATRMEAVMDDKDIDLYTGIVEHREGIDLIPSNLELAATEMKLVSTISRELVLKNSLEGLKDEYDFIILDCPPSLSMLTINALAAADKIIVPVQAHYLPARGLTQLISTINKVKRQINPSLEIAGVLLTFVDTRTNISKETERAIRDNYGEYIKIYDTTIPEAVSAAESPSKGKSIYAHAKNSKVAKSYENFCEEVLSDAKREITHQLNFSR